MLELVTLTDNEAAAILSAARTLGPADDALAQLAITAGLRLHEIADLDTNDITSQHETGRLDGQDVDPDRGPTDLHDETGPNYFVRIGFGKGPRTIPVAQPASRALHAWQAGRPSNTPLFPDASTKEQVTARWKHLLREAGVHRAAGEAGALEGGRNRLLRYLLALEAQGVLPYGHAAAYLGLPGTDPRELPPRWHDGVVQAIADRPVGQDVGAPTEEE
ncbi:tyrosine-type recombinase/integrase [Kitasatospora sp. SC0581]|uniref:tyrosine-type recombinase/integrase n=1 Tax=Kitasatospora sp. SC0581 TaxID=3394360 RepID=UPI003A893BDE